MSERTSDTATGMQPEDACRRPEDNASAEPAAIPAGPWQGLPEFGAALAAAREARGLSRQEVAERLRLGCEVVAGMEEGTIMELRPPAYARGFLRSYAVFLRLPGEWYEPLLRALAPRPVVRQEAYYRPDKTARPPRRNPVLGILASLVIAVAAVWALWHFNVIELLVSDNTPSQTAVVPMQTYETPPLAPMPETPAAPAAPAAPSAPSGDVLPGGMQQPAVNPNLPAGAGSVVSVGSPSRTVAPGMPETDREPLPAVVSPNSPWATLQGNATLAGQAGLATPESEPEPRPAANPNLPAGVDSLPADGRHQISIVAEARCWTQVTADSGRPVQQTLQPGENISYPFENKLVLRLGNAGGVRVFLDGVEQTDRGRPGQVRTLIFPGAAEPPR